LKYFLHILFVLIPVTNLVGQTTPFQENSKWGIKENHKTIVDPIYDTIFNFDSTGKVCLACYRTKTASASKFIKMMVTTYYCNYLNRKQKRLSIKTETNDTCTVFSYGKKAVKQYLNNSPYFVVSVKNKKYLLEKRDFKQLTFKGYHDINISPDPEFYITQSINPADVIVTGLINTREEEIIPYNYSTIKINPKDSVIIACSASVRNNAEDDIFNYKGKKTMGSRRHIDMATKNFLIHKIYEPREYYILYNVTTKAEKELDADEVHFAEHDNILVKIKDDWYTYDMNSNEKKLVKK
jgi:hypothetical protein